MARRPRAAFRAPLALAAVSCLVALSACALVAPSRDPERPPVPGPEAHCAAACSATLHACSPAQCERECLFILDKLVEHEEAHVLACVAKAAPGGRGGQGEQGKCDDATFADCAVRTGPYLNGGPPPPRPPSGDDDL